MNWLTNLLGGGSSPAASGANSTLSTPTTSSGSSWGSLLNGLVNLGTTGVNAYSTVANAGKSTTGSTSTTTAAAGTPTWLPIAIVGGLGVLLLALLFRRD